MTTEVNGVKTQAENEKTAKRKPRLTKRLTQLESDPKVLETYGARRANPRRASCCADRDDVAHVVERLKTIYSDPSELFKHARVVGSAEIAENEFNLNVPRYVDTFEPGP